MNIQIENNPFVQGIHIIAPTPNSRLCTHASHDSLTCTLPLYTCQEDCWMRRIGAGISPDGGFVKPNPASADYSVLLEKLPGHEHLLLYVGQGKKRCVWCNEEVLVH